MKSLIQSSPVQSSPVHKKLSALVGLSLALGLTLSANVQADSVKSQYSGNGHFYKRFDNSVIIWTDAKTACEGIGAHLATITSQGEQTFVYGLISGTPSGNYAIGATDAAIEGSWQWITGEASDGWAYDNWMYDHPDGSGNYMYIYHGGNLDGQWWDGWADGSYGDRRGYLCKWSTNNYIGSAKVPDQNANGYPEDAMLYVDFKTSNHSVIVKDRRTHATVGIKLTFAKDDRPPKGIAVVADTNNNGKVEVAVLDTNYSTDTPVVRLKDIHNNAAYVRSITFFSNQYRAVSLAVEADINGNGAHELTVTAIKKDTGAASTQTRDSKTGSLLYSNNF